MIGDNVDEIVKKLKVLLVEDDKASMSFLKVIMEKSHALFLADDGAKGEKPHLKFGY